MKTIKSMEDMSRYYNEEKNTYFFKENGDLLDVKFEMDIDVNANIDAGDVIAHNVKALGVNVYDFTVDDAAVDSIDASNVSYLGVCCAFNDIACYSIKGRKDNSKHFCLGGKIIIRK